MEELLAAIAEAPVPVIARVNGHARAGGLGLICASDLAVAAAPSTFGFSEVRIGVAPALIAVPALRVADRRFLARTMLTGESFDAAAGRRGRAADRGGARRARPSTPGWPARSGPSSSPPRARWPPPSHCCAP